MPNTQTSVPLYAQGEVLTAANLNLTNSGIPVFATTVTRDAAFGGAGEKALAEGQFAYIEATNTTQYYDGAAWQTVGASSGLTLISSTTIGTTVASVTVSSAFSSTYDNYQITISGGIASTTVNLGLQLGSTTTGYYAGYPGVNVNTNASSNSSNNSASSFTLAGMGSANGLHANIFLLSPNLAKNTMFQSINNNFNDVFNLGSGWANNTTQFTAFTITPSSGTLTGGTIRVYGLATS